MKRTLSGTYTISATDTSELAIEAATLSGDIVRVRNEGGGAVRIGNDGGNSIGSGTGYKLPSGETVAIRTDHSEKGGRSDVYVYGASGETLSWIVIG
jgi:hypothetical protein